MSHTLNGVIIGTMLLTFGYFPLERLSGKTWYFCIKMEKTQSQIIKSMKDLRKNFKI